MIVENKEKSIKESTRIARKLLNALSKELQYNVDNHDDPAEIIYISIHIISDLTALFLKSLKQFGEVYGIEKLTEDELKKWYFLMFDKYLKIYNDSEKTKMN